MIYNCRHCKNSAGCQSSTIKTQRFSTLGWVTAVTDGITNQLHYVCYALDHEPGWNTAKNQSELRAPKYIGLCCPTFLLTKALQDQSEETLVLNYLYFAILCVLQQHVTHLISSDCRKGGFLYWKTLPNQIFKLH